MLDTLAFWDIVGFIGDFMILGVYMMLQMGRLSSDGYFYLCTNVFGSVAVLASLIADWHLPDFIIQSGWLFISIAALARLLMQKRAHRHLLKNPTVSPSLAFDSST